MRAQLADIRSMDSLLSYKRRAAHLSARDGPRAKKMVKLHTGYTWKAPHRPGGALFCYCAVLSPLSSGTTLFPVASTAVLAAAKPLMRMGGTSTPRATMFSRMLVISLMM